MGYIYKWGVTKVLLEYPKISCTIEMINAKTVLGKSTVPHIFTNTVYSASAYIRQVL